MTWRGIAPSGLIATINQGGGVGDVGYEEPRGDVSGVVDNLIVIRLRGRDLSPSVPVSGDVLYYDGAQWVPSELSALVSISGVPHNLLSDTHSDTTPYSPPVDGDIIAGSGTKWTRFPIGIPNQRLGVSSSGELIWSFDPLDIITSGGVVNLTSNSHRIVVNKTLGSPTTINLPTSPFYGQEVRIKDGKGDAATNNVTISHPSGIDAWSSVIMKHDYQSFDFLWNGTQWNIV